MDEDKIYEAADTQHVLVTRSEILRLGGSDAATSRRTQSGRWQTVQAGVYQLDRRRNPWMGSLLAAVLAAGDGAVASHRAALILWNLDGIATAPVEITVPYTHGPIPRATIVHRTRRPIAGQKVKGIPATPVERTLLDCCAILKGMIMAKAVESALRKRLTTVDRLLDFLREFGGRGVKGTKLLRNILANRRSDTATDSGSETEAIVLIRRHGIEEPILQYRFTTSRGDRVRPDFYWPRLGKAIEIDGIDAHDSADKLDHDLQRQNDLMDLGIELRRFSARLVRRDPNRFVADVRRFLAR